MGYLILILPALILSIYAQFKVKSTFSKYSAVRSLKGITGREAAYGLLRNNGINDVAIEAFAAA